MKLLSLMRHGDAPYATNSNDFERKLSDKGKQESEKASLYLSSQYLIDSIISSNAPRAIATAEIIHNKYPNTQIGVDPVIYSKFNKDVLEAIISIKKDCNHMLVIGHNPTIFQCIIDLLGNNIITCNKIALLQMNSSKIITLRINISQPGSYLYELDDIFEPY